MPSWQLHQKPHESFDPRLPRSVQSGGALMSGQHTMSVAGCSAHLGSHCDANGLGGRTGAGCNAERSVEGEGVISSVRRWRLTEHLHGVSVQLDAHCLGGVVLWGVG